MSRQKKEMLDLTDSVAADDAKRSPGRFPFA